MLFAVFTCVLTIAKVNTFLLDDQAPLLGQYGRTLVLVGGHLYENNTEVYETIVKLAGGVRVAKIGIVSAASGDPVDSCNYYTDLFYNRYQAKSVYCIPVNINRTSLNLDKTVVDRIKEQTGFFFGGGDQQRVIDAFFGNGHVASPAMVAIKERYDAGAVIAGSSAGTACQTSSVMIRGGMSWDALRYGASETENQDHPDDLIFNKDGGIGILDGFILDTHFSQRGREGRLIRLLSDTRSLRHGVDWGIGIDENTALVITHAGTDQAKGQVLGQNGVFLADVSRSHVETGTRYFNIDNVMVHFLTHGDGIWLRNKTIMFSSKKTMMTGHEHYDHALTTHDIFGGSRRHPTQKPEFTRVATSVFDARKDSNSYGDSYERSPTFRVHMSRNVLGAEGYVERKHSFHTDITSYTNFFRMDLPYSRFYYPFHFHQQRTSPDDSGSLHPTEQQPFRTCYPPPPVYYPTAQHILPKPVPELSYNKNDLRSSVFKQILDTFPDLSNMIARSFQQPNGAPSACIYTSTPKDRYSERRPYDTNIASDIMAEEFESTTPHVDELAVDELMTDVTEKPFQPIDNTNLKQKITCTVCHKLFSSKANLRVHQLSHQDNSRPHACQYCGKRFTQRSTLRTHIRSHTGERPYACSFCPKRFADFSTFTKHERIHTGYRPYVCPICGKGFAQSGNMLRHKETHSAKC